MDKVFIEFGQFWYFFELGEKASKVLLSVKVVKIVIFDALSHECQ